MPSNGWPRTSRAYGQTLGCVVSAVGGGDEHLHLLLELPHTKTLDEISGELTKASARLVREAFGPKNFAWDTAYEVSSVGPDDVETIAAYVRENAARHESGDLLPDYEGNPSEMAGSDDDTPDWLRKPSISGAGTGEPCVASLTSGALQEGIYGLRRVIRITCRAAA